MEAAVIVTYRCNARCHMCNTWQFPTSEKEEIGTETLKRLPSLDFCNITGGEPFLRDDIEEIVSVVRAKAKRVVISTNGFFTDRVLSVARRNPEIGVRISIEGLPSANDELRGIKDGFDHGLRTLLELRRMGLKDIGFGITVSDRNARDMIELFHLAKSMDLEFATAVVHNSEYFHKYDNSIKKKEEVIGSFKELIVELLKSTKPKSWFRAYFNWGLINFIEDRLRLLPCEAGIENFFVDPLGAIYPCNGLERSVWSKSMGNLNERPFEEIWNGEAAGEVREMVRKCPKNCWMIGTAAPVMKKYIKVPLRWVAKNKLKIMLGRDICLGC